MSSQREPSHNYSLEELRLLYGEQYRAYLHCLDSEQWQEAENYTRILDTFIEIHDLSFDERKRAEAEAKALFIAAREAFE